MKKSTLILILIATIFTSIVFLNIIYFFLDKYLPIIVSSSFFFIALCGTHYLYLIKKINVLSYIIFIVFSLPFIHIPYYIFFEFGTYKYWLYGLASNPYMLDQTVIELTAMLGVTGSCALIIGFLLSGGKNEFKNKLLLKSPPDGFKTLNIYFSFLFLMLGLFFTLISYPSDSLFDKAYGSPNTVKEGINFASSWMVGLIIITFVYCDAWLDRSKNYGFYKRILCLIFILYIVIFLQLMRGDREGLPWIIAILSCPLFCSRIFTDIKNYKINKLTVLSIILLILFINLLVGIMRIALLDLHLAEIFDLLVYYFTADACPHRACYGFLDLFNGTWSAVLLTPISLAGDHVYDSYIYQYSGLNWGSDYLDLFLSLPPGFVADFFGYVRPIDGSNGPAWEMRYGAGGVHAIVLPFRNFSIVGILVIFTFIGFLISKIEVSTMKNFTVSGLALILTLITTSPHWLWYGDKSIMNALIIWFGFSLLYRTLSNSKYIFKKHKKVL